MYLETGFLESVVKSSLKSLGEKDFTHVDEIVEIVQTVFSNTGDIRIYLGEIEVKITELIVRKYNFGEYSLVLDFVTTKWELAVQLWRDI